MSDFMQQGNVATLHRLPGVDPTTLEGDLETYAAQRPSALLIPALASEMDVPALGGILEHLATVSYLSEIVLVLGRADRKDYDRLRNLLKALPTASTVVWPGGPKLEKLFAGVKETTDIGPPGKGRDVWVAIGYLLGKGGVHSLALHDADIVTYTREIPLRLLMPLICPDLDFSFCKGYYPRVSGRSLAGRVTRLLVWPLVDVLTSESPSEILRILGLMRYPLAGEFAMTSELAARIPVPRDWGLEVGILAAVARMVSQGDICQSELCDNYEHKHQALSPDDAGQGLHRMALEVAESMMRESEPPDGWSEDIDRRYAEKAVEMIPLYRADALANGLNYDDGAEREAVGIFTRAVEVARGRLAGKQNYPPLPPWNEVEERLPGIKEAVFKAVQEEGNP